MKDHPNKPSRDSRDCQWPIGDPATSDFHFCGAERIPTRPYCAEHFQLAYPSETKRALKHSSLGSVHPPIGQRRDR